MNEIRNSTLLRSVGFFLALANILTFAFWSNFALFFAATTDSMRVCWPFLPMCQEFPRFNNMEVSCFLVAYLILAATSALLFLFPRTVRAAYGLLLLTTLFKVILYLQDYRLMGNYHYMHFWYSFAYFFLPQRALTLRFLLMAFYFCAGLLKINWEWISGAALFRETILHGRVLQAACVYVIVLELVLIFGLLAKRDWVFWLTVAQLAVFHIFSYFVVDYYYPGIMFCLLSVVVAGRVLEPIAWNAWRLWRWPGRLFLLIFFLAQAVPWLMGGDPAVQGRGRLFSLNMLDAKTECAWTAQARFQDHSERLFPLYPDVGARLWCDPYIMMADARHRCRLLRPRPGFVDLDVSLRSKRKTDAKTVLIFEFKDFCSQPHAIDIWGRIN